ncbi:12-oxophytodienoate reductase [Microbacterium sp. A82]|uniref:oxidoreductase n=1 Tax=Microbacterium sp. A82 TaxID=3450452 RepID=UPI003F3DF911
MSTLFDPLQLRGTAIANRIVMSPMTRTHSPNGVPGEDVATYYWRRAVGGTGLLITEGVAIDHPSSVDHSDVPRLFGEESLQGWRRVVEGVHDAGGRIMPQLWHVGPLWGTMQGGSSPAMRPSGLWGTPGVTAYPAEVVAALRHPTTEMSEHDLRAVLDAYRRAAAAAAETGFDGVAIHGAHGYLLDAFLWADTNRRQDEWGGDAARRAAFPAAVVRAVRAEIGEDLPILFRFSQHKQQDFKAKLAETPDELAQLLRPLVDAGADVLDASTRRFDAPAFDGSDLPLAGWAKQLTGAMAMAVGSFGLRAFRRDGSASTAVDSMGSRAELERRLDADEFDLIAVGRMHLADPGLASTLRNDAPLPEFDRERHEFTLR